MISEPLAQSAYIPVNVLFRSRWVVRPSETGQFVVLDGLARMASELHEGREAWARA